MVRKLRIAILILDNLTVRATHKKQYFDSFQFLGLKVIKDVIEANDMEVEYCSMANIDDFDVVLVSLIGVLDAYNLVYTFAKHGKKAKDVKPKVIVGGAGITNVKTIAEYGDYFVFGRGEKSIVPILQDILREQELPSNVWKTSRKLVKVDFAQTAALYKFYNESKIQEVMLGCPFKCRFCFYTFTRKYLNNSGKYVDSKFWKGAYEETFRDLDIKDAAIHVSAIDGYSERLRKAFIKPVDEKLIEEKFVEFSKRKIVPRISLKLYQICGFPSETEDDRQEFFSLLRKIDEKCEPGRMILMVVNTPFNAMPLTPAQYEAVDVLTNWREYFKGLATGEGWIFKGNFLELYTHFNIPSSLTLLKYMIICRGGFDDAKLVRKLVLDKKFASENSTRVVNTILAKYPNAEKFVKQYEIGDRGEWDYLTTYISHETIDKNAVDLRNKLRK